MRWPALRQYKEREKHYILKLRVVRLRIFVHLIYHTYLSYSPKRKCRINLFNVSIILVDMQ